MHQLQQQPGHTCHEDSTAFLDLINTWWIISNAKTRFDHNPLGNQGDHKIWYTDFVLTTQTMGAMITTLPGYAMLINDLLEEYTFVLTSRLQSERYHG